MRLFYGLSLPDDIRRQQARLALAAESIIPGRYALPENHHLTLAFLGEVTQAQLPQAKAVIARCAAAFPAPRITLSGFSYFNKPENAILILKAQSNPALEPLNAALKAALSEENLPFDPGPFSPHVTLARRAALGEAPVFPGFDAPPSFTAHEAHLFLSARDEENVLRYTPIHTVSFANSGF